MHGLVIFKYDPWRASRQSTGLTRTDCNLGGKIWGKPMTHLPSSKSVDQAAFANVRKANDADGDAQRHDRFVHFVEGEQFRGCARCQVQFVRSCRPAERNESVGVARRRCLSHGPVFSRGTRSTLEQYGRRSESMRSWAYAPNLLRQNETLALRFVPAYPSL